MCGWTYRKVCRSWMYVSVAASWLVGFVDGCVRWCVVVVCMYEWVCR